VYSDDEAEWRRVGACRKRCCFFRRRSVNAARGLSKHAQHAEADDSRAEPENRHDGRRALVLRARTGRFVFSHCLPLRNESDGCSIRSFHDRSVPAAL
jgi:hypothetical protein